MGGLTASGRVSVVIPTFDRRLMLPQALDSVIAQSRAPCEIIVVDDGSTDGTAEMMAADYADVCCLRQPRRGVSTARNAGIQRAQGEWVAFLDSDDAWKPNKLERQLAALAAHPDQRLCHTDEIWVRGGVRVNPKRKHAKRGGMIFEACLPLCCISPSSVMIHRTVFDAVGAFDENLPACEDYDLWLRICSRFPVLFLDEPLVIKHGGHDDQLSRAHFGMDRFRIAALEKILRFGCLDPPQTASARAMLAEKIRVYANGARKRGKLDEADRYERKLGVRARGRVNIVVALTCEAKPLIHHYELVPSAARTAFRELGNADDTIRLVISGVGRRNAAAATAQLVDRQGDGAWLNVGTAGHLEHALGTPWLAHRIIDSAGGRVWYPPIVFEPPCASATVRTIDAACLDYLTDDLYEMEAAAFFETARRAATHELVQSLKIISDNRSTGPMSITASGVEKLIELNLDTIAALVELLADLDGRQQSPDSVPAGLAEIVDRVHFTTTQRRQLERLLRRWHLLLPGKDPAAAGLENVGPARDRHAARHVLDMLTATVAGAARVSTPW